MLVFFGVVPSIPLTTFLFYAYSGVTPSHWGPVHDGEPGRAGEPGLLVRANVSLATGLPHCPRRSTTAPVPIGGPGVEYGSLCAEDPKQRGLTEAGGMHIPVP
jgi:hypothetical protein